MAGGAQTAGRQLAGQTVDVRSGAPQRWLAMPVGLATIGFSTLYLASDVLEVGQGHFSTVRLALTYAYSCVFFTSTVVYALVAHTPDYQGVTKAFGAWMVIHGLIMRIGGTAFGVAAVRALVAAASGLPAIARTVAEAVPAAAFIGMGTALLRGSDHVPD